MMTHKNLKVFLQINAVVDWWSDQKLSDREREHIAHPRCYLNLRQPPPAVQKTNRLSPVAQRNLQNSSKENIYTRTNWWSTAATLDGL